LLQIDSLELSGLVVGSNVVVEGEMAKPLELDASVVGRDKATALVELGRVRVQLDP
jgi:hypothetical protein